MLLNVCLPQVGIGDGCPDGLSGEDMAAAHATLLSLAESLDSDLSLLREKQAEVTVTVVHLYVYTFIHLYIYTFIHLYICTFIHLYIYTI